MITNRFALFHLRAKASEFSRSRKYKEDIVKMYLRDLKEAGFIKSEMDEISEDENLLVNLIDKFESDSDFYIKNDFLNDLKFQLNRIRNKYHEVINKYKKD